MKSEKNRYNQWCWKEAQTKASSDSKIIAMTLILVLKEELDQRGKRDI